MKMAAVIVSPSRDCRSNYCFSDTSLYFRVWNTSREPIQTSVALVAYSSVCDIVVTNRTGVIGSRAWIQMYVATHLEEELGLVWSSS